MPTYRAYTLNAAGRITWGEWIEAENLADAEAQAAQLCKSGAPTVEIWEGAKRLAEIACDPEEPAA